MRKKHFYKSLIIINSIPTAIRTMYLCIKYFLKKTITDKSVSQAIARFGLEI